MSGGIHEGGPVPHWKKLFIPTRFGQDTFIPQTAGCEHFLSMVARAETFPASTALVKLPFSDRSCEKSSGTAWEFVNSLALGCESWWCEWQQRFNKHLCIFLSSLEFTPDTREPASCAFQRGKEPCFKGAPVLCVL